ncbi:hypothetical protein IEQ34_017410 [Dendrobium chrysotoxum]|uniref:Serine/threonine-protein phosphatase 2A 55 kDa regulatory subunit B n=1 Tax=Dendrobium chrysotoxum TaxID=161865 RepID=A0AAV7G9K2_DENCH|nr:hypothetical protein IEQ34_017410 [Dendrobium chrysotoxum]
MNGKVGSEASAATPSSLLPPLEWKFSQVFGERTAGEGVQEVDFISAIQFDKSGDHLATGDKGGRVVLFERTDVKEHSSRRDLEKLDYTFYGHPEFRYKTEFQSHEPEFDYLKSLEIEEKINKIRWFQTTNGALFILSTNDKTIKFWKVQEKKVKRLSVMNLDHSQAARNDNFGCSSTASPKVSLTNGVYADSPYKYQSNDFEFFSAGFPSLRLPMVFVFNPA